MYALARRLERYFCLRKIARKVDWHGVAYTGYPRTTPGLGGYSAMGNLMHHPWMILKRVVAGLKMAHLPKITSSLEFWSARPDGARV
jgi:hypothetical protein